MRTSRKDDGAVLLTTLLVMSLMATLAVAIMDDIRFAVKRAANIQAYAQADWYAKGAEDFAASYLSKQIKSANRQQLNISLLEGQPVVLPIDGGAITLSVRDGAQCLSLAAIGTGSGARLFRQLLTTLGWSEADAARLTTLAVDWQDADSEILPGGAEDYTYLGRRPAHRTANSPFASITELRALNALSEDEYQALRPYICAREAAREGRVNINTLSLQQAPLLAAILGGPEALNAAAQLISERPGAGYNDLEALRAAFDVQKFEIKNAQLDQIGFKADFIWVEAEIIYQSARRIIAFEFAIEGDQFVRLYRGFGDEALRPQLKAPTL